MFTIEMLPAAEGDSLWIEYGHVNRPWRVLIDGGPARTYHSLRSRILALPPEQRRFELVVVTHIDADHIDGIIRLLQDETLDIAVGDVWFNGYPQLFPADTQGAAEGEILGYLLETSHLPWNRAFDGGAVVADDGSPFPTRNLAGGMAVTVLGPTWTELTALGTEWDHVLEEEGWVTGDVARAQQELERRARLRRPAPIEAAPADVLGDDVFTGDPSVANGASIVLLLEDGEGRSALFTGDAHAPPLRRALEQADGGAGLRIDAFKLPHHGSRNNLNDEVLALVDAKRYLVSSSGAKYGHPDEITIERILRNHHGRSKPRIDFNYRSAFSEAWADPDMQRERRFIATFPSGIAVEL